ncbi:hypothetical protein THAOC_21229, partial [Thalassiosira oceanica]
VARKEHYSPPAREDGAGPFECLSVSLVSGGCVDGPAWDVSVVPGPAAGDRAEPGVDGPGPPQEEQGERQAPWTLHVPTSPCNTAMSNDAHEGHRSSYLPRRAKMNEALASEQRSEAALRASERAHAMLP